MKLQMLSLITCFVSVQSHILILIILNKLNSGYIEIKLDKSVLIWFEFAYIVCFIYSTLQWNPNEICPSKEQIQTNTVNDSTELWFKKMLKFFLVYYCLGFNEI